MVTALQTPPKTLKVVIATRESRLALWQAEHVKALLETRLGWQVELLGMTTLGDQILDRSLSKVGGKGLFVKELETALADGRVHPRRFEHYRSIRAEIAEAKRLNPGW